MNPRSTARAFERTRAEGRSALVGYLPAGFPDVDGSIEAIKVMVEHGNMRNARDARLLQAPREQERMAAALTAALVDWHAAEATVPRP